MRTDSITCRCIIADDHPAITDALARFLEDAPDVELVGRAHDGEQAMQMIDAEVPDIAILDIRMPRVGGIEIARTLTEQQAKTLAVLYTAYAERALLLEALDAGARGFLLKEAPLEDLLRAIRLVSKGETYIDPGLAGVLVGPQSTERLPNLTAREREVLRLLADGMRNEQVGLELGISPLTVRTHVKNAMDKLAADTRTEAVASALRQSLIS